MWWHRPQKNCFLSSIWWFFKKVIWGRIFPFQKTVSPFGNFKKRKRKAQLLISIEEEFICNFNGFFLNLKPQVSCPMLLKKIAAVLLYSLHSQLWANILLGWLWWSFFFFCGKKKRQKATLVHFLGKISPFLKNKSQNFKFSPFFAGRDCRPKSSYWLHFLMVLYKTIAN
jgi:hypothetical protein